MWGRTRANSRHWLRYNTHRVCDWSGSPQRCGTICAEGAPWWIATWRASWHAGEDYDRRFSNTIGLVRSLQCGPSSAERSWDDGDKKIRREGYRKTGGFTSATVSDKERKQNRALHWWWTLTQKLCFLSVRSDVFCLCQKNLPDTNVTNWKWMWGTCS